MRISRRDFLKASGLAAAWTALAACAPKKQVTTPDIPNPTSTSTPLATTSASPAPTVAPTALPVLEGDALLLHTLRRITFGATPDMIDNARRNGLNAFLEEQLSPESIPDLEIDPMLKPYSTLTMSVAERLRLELKRYSSSELIEATLLRQWFSQRQLFEMVVDFWSNHFNIYVAKNLCHILKTDDDLKVIRPNALGKFRDLLHASARSPAMLIYLDQADSIGKSPNENYARELLELHTVSVDEGYSHHDVAEVARALTGWTVSSRHDQVMGPGIYYFDPKIHNGGDKQVLGTTISEAGEEEGTQILDLLARHPSTARFISTKLARRFVSDSPDPALVDSLAQTFTQTDGDTREMLRTLFNSDSFKASAGQKFKRPLEFFISALRVSGTSTSGNLRKLGDQLELLGQVPFSWDLPNGYPDVEEHWATTSGLLDRWNFGMLLISNSIKGTEVDLNTLTKDAASAQDVVDVLSIRFLGERLPDDARAILVDFASSGDLGALRPSIAGLILGSPHFQVR